MIAAGLPVARVDAAATTSCFFEVSNRACAAVYASAKGTAPIKMAMATIIVMKIGMVILKPMESNLFSFAGAANHVGVPRSSAPARDQHSTAPF
jgi:hypothetical protein